MAIDVGRYIFEDERVWHRPLARNRVLVGLGTAMFGLAASAVMPKRAEADHGPVFYGCNTCSCCVWGPGCCVDNCTTCYCGCHTGGICWYTCFHGDYYKCCDFKHPGDNCCICRTYLGSC
jgi:hypothetical protein